MLITHFEPEVTGVTILSLEIMRFEYVDIFDTILLIIVLMVLALVSTLLTYPFVSSSIESKLELGV